MTENFTELAFAEGEKTTQQLLTPFTLGPHQLRNRVVMAPLTRMRSLPGNVPGPLTAT